jgi:hypothetical protein
MNLGGKNRLPLSLKRSLRQYFWSPEREYRLYKNWQIYRRAFVITANGLPTNIKDRLGITTKRVILVANNGERPPPTSLIASLSYNDLVVQYNACRHYEYFKRSNCSKLFVFREYGCTGFNFGFSRKVRMFADLNKNIDDQALSILFINNIPDLTRHPRGLEKILKNADACSLVETSEPMFETYPTPQGYKFAGPSTGFATLIHFLQARERLRRKEASDFEIVLCGFSTTSEGESWEGHNWAYERKFIAGLAGDQVTFANDHSKN